MTDPKTPLDAFFDAARAEQPQPSSDLMARVRNDAQSVIKQTATAPQRPPSFGQRIMAIWPVWSGCVPAALVGLWIGINPPDALPDPLLWIDASEAQVSDLSSDFDDWIWNFEEGQL